MTWEIVRLGDVASIERKSVSPDSLPGETRYLGLEHIARGGTIINSSTTSEAKLASSKFVFGSKHVLFGKLRPNLGKIARPDFSGVCSTDILPIQPGAQLDRDFLTNFLRQQSTIDIAAANASGANLPRLSPTALSAIEIPLPPLEEQRRIAAILDEADEIRTKRRAQLALLDELPQSLFHEMFGDPTEWSGRWRFGTIGEMAESVSYGSSAKAGSAGDWPILRMGHLSDDGRLDLTDLKYLDLASGDVEKYTLRTGDVLFNRTNSIEKVGKSAVVRSDRPLAYAGYLIRVRVKPEHQPDFLVAFLNGNYGRALRRSIAKSAVNQANINASQLKGIQIPLPPLAEQQAFAEKVEAIQAERSRITTALKADDELFTALQYRAFRGEL